MNKSQDYSVDVRLDLTGLKCPLPVLKARRQVKQMDGGVLEVLADDPAAPLDFEHLCDTGGLTLLKSEKRGGGFVFHISAPRKRVQAG